MLESSLALGLWNAGDVMIDAKKYRSQLATFLFRAGKTKQDYVEWRGSWTTKVMPFEYRQSDAFDQKKREFATFYSDEANRLFGDSLRTETNSKNALKRMGVWLSSL